MFQQGSAITFDLRYAESRWQVLDVCAWFGDTIDWREAKLLMLFPHLGEWPSRSAIGGLTSECRTKVIIFT